MPLIYQSRIYRADLRANTDVLYVFGDNEKRIGEGGQAGEMRGEPNAIGVATLRAPGVYFNSHDTDRQCTIIDRDLEPVRKALKAGKVVVWPLDGIGTGIAELKQRAPATHDFIQMQRRVMEQIP